VQHNSRRINRAAQAVLENPFEFSGQVFGDASGGASSPFFLRFSQQLDASYLSICADRLKELRPIAARSRRKGENALPGKQSPENLSRNRRDFSARLRARFNATGIVLHTNLGRAPLGEEVLSRMRKQLPRSYCTLEIEPEKGKRGKRTAKWNVRSRF